MARDMKKLLCLFLSFFVFPAIAVTSESYVDSAVAPLQDEIPAVDANTVLTNTGVAGEIGTKKIYDETQDFATQTDALVTAETFNAAVQNAIDTEFVCIESIPEGCLLYKIMVKQTPPSTYTQLEYIESTGTQYIDTGVSGLDAGDWEIFIKWMTTAAPDVSYPEVIAAYSSENANAYRIILSLNPKVPLIYGNTLAAGGHQTSHLELNSVGTATLKNGSAIFNNRYYDLAGKKRGDPIASNATIKMLRGLKGRIYASNATKDGVLMYNAIPARRNSDNVLGMYDTVTGTFFTNAGTGEFIAGPDVVSNLYLPSGD